MVGETFINVEGENKNVDMLRDSFVFEMEFSDEIVVAVPGFQRRMFTCILTTEASSSPTTAFLRDSRKQWKP